MVKKTIAVFFSFISLVLLVSLSHGQCTKKTITLPNGDVVCDLNGDWDALIDHYGPWSGIGTYPDIVKITQEGSSFIGIRMIGSAAVPKGAEWMLGELGEIGIKKIQLVVSSIGPIFCKGQISEGGKKIIVDDGEKYRVTLTRK